MEEKEIKIHTKKRLSGADIARRGKCGQWEGRRERRRGEDGGKKTEKKTFRKKSSAYFGSA